MPLEKSADGTLKLRVQIHMIYTRNRSKNVMLLTLYNLFKQAKEVPVFQKEKKANKAALILNATLSCSQSCVQRSAPLQQQPEQ